LRLFWSISPVILFSLLFLASLLSTENGADEGEKAGSGQESDKGNKDLHYWSREFYRVAPVRESHGVDAAHRSGGGCVQRQDQAPP
jgi:hypothetical protein